MTNQTNPITRLVHRLTGHQAPKPKPPEPEPELEPTVRMRRTFIKYGD